MHPESKIFVAGHRGLVGSALMRCLERQGYCNVITRRHEELDLTKQQDVVDFFSLEKPDYVFLAAAKVGGIYANNSYPAEFIHQNLIIQDNVIHQAWTCGVKRLLFLGSSCIYPRDCKQPMREKYLLTGPLESTNRPYAVAKIAGIESCWAYNRQYGTRFFAAMPTNLYGPGDNYDLNNSHVLPALIRKMHEAKEQKKEEMIAWGTGSPRREFLYSDDMADACVFLMSLPDSKLSGLFQENLPPLINVGCGADLTIKSLVEIVRDIVGFNGDVKWDESRSDGTPRKLLDVRHLFELGWRPKKELAAGIRIAYADYKTSLQT